MVDHAIKQLLTEIEELRDYIINNKNSSLDLRQSVIYNESIFKLRENIEDKCIRLRNKTDDLLTYLKVVMSLYRE